MQTRCPNCTSIVRTSDGAGWIIINGACPELAGTRWGKHLEFCPTLAQVAQPDVTLPGIADRDAVLAEIAGSKRAPRAQQSGS